MKGQPAHPGSPGKNAVKMEREGEREGERERQRESVLECCWFH